MGLRDEAAARQAANSEAAAAADRERARIDSTRHHVRDDALVELAQLCRQEGVVPMRVVPDSGPSFEGWVFYVHFNKRYFFDEQGYLYAEPVEITVEPKGWFQKTRTEMRPGVPIFDGEGAYYASGEWKTKPLREWAVEAAAEVLAGRAAEGVIPLNSRVAQEQYDRWRANIG